MKKRIIETAITAILFLTLIGYTVYYSRLPDYKVYNSFATMGKDFRETEINVIIYKNKSKDLYKEIEEEHNKINGEPTQLTIRLYNKEKEIKKGGAPYATIFIDYTDNTYEIL